MSSVRTASKAPWLIARGRILGLVSVFAFAGVMAGTGTAAAQASTHGAKAVASAADPGLYRPATFDDPAQFVLESPADDDCLGVDSDGLAALQTCTDSGNQVWQWTGSPEYVTTEAGTVTFYQLENSGSKANQQCMNVNTTSLDVTGYTCDSRTTEYWHQNGLGGGEAAFENMEEGMLTTGGAAGEDVYGDGSGNVPWIIVSV
jgi:hypothetical protein